MKKSCFALIIWLLLSIVLKAQNDTVQLQELHAHFNITTHDTSKVKIYHQLFEYYTEFNWDSAFFYSQRELMLSKRIKFVWGESAALQSLGYLAMQKGNYPQSLDLLFQSVKLSESIPNDSLTADIYQNIGLTYFYIEDYKKARNYFLKSERLVENTRYKVTYFYVLKNLGRTYLKLNEPDSALVAIQKAYALCNNIADKKYLSGVLTTLGEIHILKGNREVGIAFLHQAAAEAKARGNKRSEIISSLSFAGYFKDIRQFDSVIVYATQALTLSQEKYFIQYSLDAASILSEVNHLKGDEVMAYRYLTMATTMRNELFNQEKQTQFQNLAFNEQLRQMDEESKKIAAVEERMHNLQYAAIAIGLITFIILFFVLSRSVIVKTKFIEFFGVLGLLAVFEFVNLFIHPYLAHITNDSPVLMLVALIAIGALLIPLHHRLQKWITNIMVEKNKKIRLAAAKKTIEQLDTKPENL